MRSDRGMWWKWMWLGGLGLAGCWASPDFRAADPPPGVPPTVLVAADLPPIPEALALRDQVWGDLAALDGRRSAQETLALLTPVISAACHKPGRGAAALCPRLQETLHAGYQALAQSPTAAAAPIGTLFETLAGAQAWVGPEVCRTASDHAARDLSGVLCRARSDILGSFARHWRSYPTWVLPTQIRNRAGQVFRVDPRRTTTVLGSYAQDIAAILQTQLPCPTALPDLRVQGTPGRWNLLHAPTGVFEQLPPSYSWELVNRPFLDAAIRRGDAVWVVSHWDPADVPPDLAHRGSGLAREIAYLVAHGYHYDPKTGQIRPLQV